MMKQASRTSGSCLTEVAVFGPNASNLEAVLAMLARCSRDTLFHRFHGFTDGRAYYAGLLRDRPVDQARLAWRGATCVGVADLGVGAAGTSDLAVLVDDAWRRRGIGTRLATSLLDSARARGVTTVHADVLGDDLYILQALRRLGPLAVSIDSGTFAIDIDIRTPAAGLLPSKLKRKEPKWSQANPKLPSSLSTARGPMARAGAPSSSNYRPRATGS